MTHQQSTPQERPTYIHCTYLNGKHDDRSVARHGYAANAPFMRTPRTLNTSKRFGIESGYRLLEQAMAITTTRDLTVRMFYIIVSSLLQNVWRYLHCEYVVTPRQGGHLFWWWPYKEFINVIRRAVWTARAMRWASPAHRPPDYWFQATDRVRRLVGGNLSLSAALNPRRSKSGFDQRWSAAPTTHYDRMGDSDQVS